MLTTGTIELDEFLAWYTGRNWQMALHAGRRGRARALGERGRARLVHPAFVFLIVRVARQPPEQQRKTDERRRPRASVARHVDADREVRVVRAASF